ncbi:phosphatase PAP2 family protein [Paenibacillus cymbidii]|uniref:phosphatase PAP2 family protein n=1 Tax=Paenibacillus cymbidii TaxID=1639034 RepID=UPI001080ADCA|nr:phosphatase PAP2 family protein [Paenibacillus cymbidii]
MNRVAQWLQQQETGLFLRLNRRSRSAALDRLLGWITHAGGATATIAAATAMLLAPGQWRVAALQSLAALAASHVPVAILKRKYPRLRPYLVLPQAITCANPLRDHSFPSGHTTAIFSVCVPFVMTAPALGVALLPLAATVAYSRIYLGLHFPSDCAAGALIGTAAAAAAAAAI